MRTYRSHFVNHADEIFGVNHFEAEHDDAAIKHALDMFPSRIGKGLRDLAGCSFGSHEGILVPAG